MTVAELLARQPSTLDRRDAETLLLALLGRDRAWLLTHRHEPVADEVAARLGEQTSRRCAGEPLQYILGVQEFYGLPFRVTPAVLIPRPETELLVEAVLSELAGRENEPLKIADVGTGSGAIAVALAHHLPNAHLFATDISEAALCVARENAEANGVSDRITFRRADLLEASQVPVARSESAAGEASRDPKRPDEGLLRELQDRFSAIVSNPPYIPIGDLPSLEPQVREHEPHAALFAGADGLDVYRRLIPAAHAALVPGGLLAMEFGYGQSDGLRQLLTGGEALWNNIRLLPDLQGIPRIVLVVRPRSQP
jgi:release factor glutamine methyltransferase